MGRIGNLFAALAVGVTGLGAAAPEAVVPPNWAYLGKPFPPPAPGAPPMPCTRCHLSNGGGRPENAALDGLSRDYMIEQVADIASGKRVFPDGPLRTMLRAALAATPAEIEAAADTFSKTPYVSHVRVVETAEIPKATPHDAIWRFTTDGAREPLGQRIVEGPEDFAQFERRDPQTSIVAYVPKGSIMRGKALAAGGRGRASCASCHGEGLRGGPIAPPLAGRFPTGAFRQMWSFKVGLRDGAGAGLMKPVVAPLSEQDMIALAAYAATLKP